MEHESGLYRAEQVRELDRLTIEEHGIPGYELMQRAGRAVFDGLRANWPEVRRLTVACGGGNNGGDGYVVARLAWEIGFEVQVIALKSPAELGGDAARAAADFLEAGGSVDSAESTIQGDLMVDALLGTGLDSAPRGHYLQLIEAINRSGLPVIAVDVPSGLESDTGCAPGHCVEASATISFIGRKRGLYTGQAGRYCGQRLFDSLEVPPAVYQAQPVDAVLMESDSLPRLLPARTADTHKGDLGHVLVIGGDLGMAGAPILTGRAALRAGSGLVSLATRPSHVPIAVSAQAELMAHPIDEPGDLEGLLERADCLALGPGLGQSDWSKALFEKAMAADCPMVLDADGLNLLAGQPVAHKRLILTPHPGEAARLLECSIADIQNDRFAAVRELASKFGATAVLKGWGTLVAGNDDLPVRVCSYGNPAMATAGMGDALTGIIASLIGQGLNDLEAASTGVLLHALAGDLAAHERRHILASELIDALGKALPR